VRTLLRADVGGDGEHPNRQPRLYLLPRVLRSMVWVLWTPSSCSTT
jgi:hypothetical protein